MKKFHNYMIDTTSGKVVVVCPKTFSTAIRERIKNIEGIDDISAYPQTIDTIFYINITARATRSTRQSICEEIENIVKIATSP